MVADELFSVSTDDENKIFMYLQNDYPIFKKMGTGQSNVGQEYIFQDLDFQKSRYRLKGRLSDLTKKWTNSVVIY